MLSRPSFSLSSVLGLASTVALAVLTVNMTACARNPAYEGPELTAYEQAQHQRCVALLRSAWQGAPVKFTSAERGTSGLDYVWVNADVDDDHDDIERRSAKGASHAGHCQFDHASDVVHVHSYALNAAPGQGTTAASHAGTGLGTSDYRYFTASANDTPDAPALAATQGGSTTQ